MTTCHKEKDEDGEQCLLDTSFLVALLLPHDIHHVRAVHCLEEMTKSGHQIFLSDVSLNETPGVVVRRYVEKNKRSEIQPFLTSFQKNIRGVHVLCLYDLFLKSYRQIINLMAKTEGRLNPHDCLVAVFLKEVPAIKLATFDQGFGVVPWVRVVP